MCQQDAVTILRHLGHDGIWRVGGKHVAEAGDKVAARFEKLAGRLRDIIIGEEPKL
jgi:hypothetical protein